MIFFCKRGSASNVWKSFAKKGEWYEAIKCYREENTVDGKKADLRDAMNIVERYMKIRGIRIVGNPKRDDDPKTRWF
jgi:hypothetical protein